MNHFSLFPAGQQRGDALELVQRLSRSACQPHRSHRKYLSAQSMVKGVLYDPQQKYIFDLVLVNNITHLLGPKRNPGPARLWGYVCEGNCWHTVQLETICSHVLFQGCRAGPEQRQKWWRKVVESSMMGKNLKHLLFDRQFQTSYADSFSVCSLYIYTYVCIYVIPFPYE